MALTREQMDQVVADHFAYEANDDVEGVLGTLTDDVRHDAVGWPGGPQRGRDNARAFYEATFGDLDEGRVTGLNRYYGDNFLVDESLWEGRAVGKPFGFEGRNRPLKFRLLHVFEFSEDGKIARENVWFDMAAIAKQLP